MKNVKSAFYCILAVIFTVAIPSCGTDGEKGEAYFINVDDNKVNISAGSLVRAIDLSANKIKTMSLQVGGTEVLSQPSNEFHLTLSRAVPNREPSGLKPGDVDVPLWDNEKDHATGAIPGKQVNYNVTAPNCAVEWKYPISLDGDEISKAFEIVRKEVTSPRPGVTQLHVRTRSIEENPLQNISIDLFYEIYAGYPVIRKWIEVTNNSATWFKIDKLVIDDINLADGFRTAVPLTPEEEGAGSSVVGFGNENHSRGLIICSEIPSAPRLITGDGAVGYSSQYFEWVLAPSENFVSEPLFHFAYHGEVEQTVSGVSTPLDRTLEGQYMRFLEKCIGIRAVPAELPVPLYCMYTNFVYEINDTIVRELSDIAARVGFKCFQIDAGWSSGTNIRTDRFPDFDATSRYVTSKGINYGLWISDYRLPDDVDFEALGAPQSLPGIKRGNYGIGMSFASKWSDYYANALVYLRDRYGMKYVKQDFSSIRFGDIAQGHGNRTMKESLLRGLRGLLAAQDRLTHLAPDVTAELTHEIYWDTPGVPCDIAALKHAGTFHIPPNTYYGAGKAHTRPSPDWTFDPLKLREELIEGCWVARQRFFLHRGLPLYCIEFYSANCVNFKGSLTAAVQDRQICSWLMGVPSVFAGDLASLTDENILHYRKRFDLLERLVRGYDIYHYFQYSGVPLPTDTDWHWWGKLNEEGFGAVVVIRGDGGEESRAINIPWVQAKRKYRAKALLSDKELGTFTGVQLQNGKLTLALAAIGQEILELSPAGK